MWRETSQRVEIPLSNFPAEFTSASYVLSPGGTTGTGSIEGDLLIIEAPVGEVGIQFAISRLELSDECGNTWVYDQTEDAYVMVFVTDGGGDGDAICG